MKRRILNLLIALDQLFYVILTLGHGFPDETLSSAAYRTESQGKILGRIFRPVIDWIFSPIESEHCRKSFDSEIRRLQSPITTR